MTRTKLTLLALLGLSMNGLFASSDEDPIQKTSLDPATFALNPAAFASRILGKSQDKPSQSAAAQPAAVNPVQTSEQRMPKIVLKPPFIRNRKYQKKLPFANKTSKTVPAMVTAQLKEQPVTTHARSLLDQGLFRSSETDSLIKIVTKIKDLMASGKNEDSALATTFMINDDNLALITQAKISLVGKADPDALGADGKPLLVGAGPRLTSLLLSQGADPYAADFLAIKEAQDTLVKEKLEKKMQLLAEKLDPKAYSKPWADYLQWKKAQAKPAADKPFYAASAQAQE